MEQSQHHNRCGCLRVCKSLRAVGLWCGLLVLALPVQAVQSPRGKQLFPNLGAAKKPSIERLAMPPLPPGFAEAMATQQDQLRITNISRIGAGNFAVRWSGGEPNSTFQLQSKTNVTQSTWQNVGVPTTAFGVTNPLIGNFAIFKVAATSAPPVSGQVQWLRGATTQAGFNCRGRTIAVDHAGNYIMAGVYQGTISFGSFTLTNTGGIDIFMIKYEPGGSVVWLKRIAGTFDESVNSVAVDSADNIFVTGDFSGTVNFGGTNITYTTPFCCAAPDMFVAKYMPNGDLIWAKKFGGNSGDSGSALALDAAGNVFVAASISSTNADFNPFFLTGAANSDIAIARLSSAGTVIWAKRYGFSDIETPRAIVANAIDVWVAGDFRNVTDLGGGSVPSVGNADGFLARYSAANGIYQSAKLIGTPGSDGGYGCALDGGGNVYLCGQYGGPINLGCGLLTPGGIFVASYTSAGVCRWSRSVNHPNFGFSPDQEFANAMTIDSLNHVEIAGQVVKTVSFDGSGTSAGTGIPNYFSASYDLNGGYRWHSRASNSGIGQSISQGGIAGSFSGQMTLGGQTITGPPFGSAPFAVKIAP